MTVLYVSANTSPEKLAKVITQNVVNFKVAEVQAIGAAAVNQAVKAVAISRNFFTPGGGDLICTPSFTRVKGKNENSEIVAILFTIGKA